MEKPNIIKYSSRPYEDLRKNRDEDSEFGRFLNRKSRFKNRKVWEISADFFCGGSVVEIDSDGGGGGGDKGSCHGFTPK